MDWPKSFRMMALLCFAIAIVVPLRRLPAQAPAVDRVGFPAGYQNTFKMLHGFDNPQNRQIRVVWANDIAMQVRKDQPYFFPYGSVLLFEDFPALLDDQGNPRLDENGRYLKGDLRQVFVMRKEPGFGEGYGANRSGEWEYVAYNPQGTFTTRPENTSSCAACHKEAGAERDYLFRVEYYLNGTQGPEPTGVMKHYKFIPGVIRVKVGSTVTIYNDEALEHTFTAEDGSFDSGLFGYGKSFTIKATRPGTINIRCTRHSRMRGQIIVEP
jgi:plastocyanin